MTVPVLRIFNREFLAVVSVNRSRLLVHEVGVCLGRLGQVFSYFDKVVEN